MINHPDPNPSWYSHNLLRSSYVNVLIGAVLNTKSHDKGLQLIEDLKMILKSFANHLWLVFTKLFIIILRSSLTPGFVKKDKIFVTSFVNNDTGVYFRDRNVSDITLLYSSSTC